MWECPKCKRQFDQLPFRTSFFNINQDGLHSLIVEGNDDLQRMFDAAWKVVEENVLMKDIFGEDFLTVAAILLGECCEGDYIVIGDDLDEEQILTQIVKCVLDHDLPDDVTIEQIRHQAKRMLPYTRKRVVCWG